MALGPRAKKFIVAVLVLLWLPVYALLAMAVGIRAELIRSVPDGWP